MINGSMVTEMAIGKWPLWIAMLNRALVRGCLLLGLFVSYLLRSQVHDQSGKGRHLRQNPCQVTETRNAPESLSTHEHMQCVICYMFIYVCNIL